MFPRVEYKLIVIKPDSEEELPVEKPGGFETIIQGIKESRPSEDLEEAIPILFKLVNGYGYNNKWYCIIDPNSKEVTKRYLDHSNKIVRGLANHLMMMHLDCEIENKNGTMIRAAIELLAVIERMKLNEDIRKEGGFTPLFSAIVNRVQPPIELAKEERKALRDSLFSLAFCKEMERLAGDSWRETSTTIFGLLIRISNVLKRVINKDASIETKKKIKDNIQYVGENNLETCIGRFLNDKLRGIFPVTMTKPFCQSERDFFTLSIPPDFLARMRELDEIDQTQLRKEKKGKGRELGHACAGAGSAGGGSAGALDVVELEPSHPVSAPFSIEVAREKLASISLAERVAIWKTSLEGALELYNYHENPRLNIEDMILRHRLPDQLLLFMFHADYARKGSWNREDHRGRSISHEHWDMVVKINNNTHIVECTVDEGGFLYHYYAREVRQIADIIMTLQAPSEYPPLCESTKERSATASKVVLEEDIEISTSGNVIVRAYDNIYEIVKLN